MREERKKSPMRWHRAFVISRTISRLAGRRKRPCGLRVQFRLCCRSRRCRSLLGWSGLLYRGCRLLGWSGLLYRGCRLLGRSGLLYRGCRLLGWSGLLYRGCRLLGWSGLLRRSSSLLGWSGLLRRSSSLLGWGGLLRWGRSLLGWSDRFLGWSRFLRRRSRFHGCGDFLCRCGLFSRGFFRSCHCVLLDQVAKSTSSSLYAGEVIQRHEVSRMHPQWTAGC